MTTHRKTRNIAREKLDPKDKRDLQNSGAINLAQQITCTIEYAAHPSMPLPNQSNKVCLCTAKQCRVAYANSLHA